MKKNVFAGKFGIFAKVFSLAVVVFFVAPVVYLKFIARDISPVDDSAMNIAILSVPENENAYPLMLLAMVPLNNPPLEPLRLKLVATAKKLSKGEPLSDKEFNETALLFQERIETIKRASKMKYSKGPLALKADDHVPNYISFRELSILNLAVAKREFAAGKKDEAFETALAMARFGALVQQREGGTSLISLMVGVSIKENSLTAINQFLDAGYMPADPKSVIKELSDIYESETAWVNAWKVEYWLYKYAIDIYASGYSNDVAQMMIGEQHSFLDNRAGAFLISLVFKPERTKKRLQYFFAARISESAGRSASEIAEFDYRSFSPATPFSPEFFKLLSRGELGTNYFVAAAIPNFKKAVEKKYYIDFLTDAVRLRLAALDYRKTNGALPDSPAALVPEYIDKLPFDRFDGKPLRYDSARKLIYSTGADLKDNGGVFKKTVVEKSSWPTDGDEKDYVLKID